jgi:ribosomal protein S11
MMITLENNINKINKKVKKPFFFNKNNLKNKKQKYEIYNLHVKKTLNNFFLTLTKTTNCNVLYHLSAGHCKIYTKKKKKSLETLRAISMKMVEFLNLNKITYIETFYISLNNKYYFKKCFKTIRKNKIYIRNVILTKIKSHNGIRKKKLKRL